MTRHYKVLSEHYEGPSAIRKSTDPPEISPDKIIVGSTFKPPTVSSFGYGSWKFYAQNGEIVTRTTGGNEFRTIERNFEKFGPVTQFDDYGMSRWKANGEKNHPSLPENNLIPSMPEILYMEGSRLNMHIASKQDTPMSKLGISNPLVEAVPMNKIGVYASKTADMKIKLHLMMKGGDNYEEAKDWIEFLGDNHLIHDTKPIVGYGTARWDQYAAAFFPADNFIAREYNFRASARKFADKYGVEGKDAIDAFERAILQHEIAHKWVGGGKKGEQLQGKLQKEFYSMMSRKHAGTRKGRIYQALSEEAKDYEKLFAARGSFIDRIFGEEQQNPGIPYPLIVRMEAEARELGLSSHEKRAYISARLNEVLGPARPYYKNRKTIAEKSISNKSSKEEQGRNLDGIIDEESQAGINRQPYSKRADNIIYAKERFQNSKYAKGKAARSKKGKEDNRKSSKAKAA